MLAFYNIMQNSSIVGVSVMCSRLIKVFLLAHVFMSILLFIYVEISACFSSIYSLKNV